MAGGFDRCHLETDFSKGHLSEILRGKNSPSVDTPIRLAKVFDCEVNDFFIFLERSARDRVLVFVCAAAACGSRPNIGGWDQTSGADFNRGSRGEDRNPLRLSENLSVRVRIAH